MGRTCPRILASQCGRNAMAKKFRPLPTAPPYAKAALFEYVDHLERLITGSLTASGVKLADVEKENLEYALKTLRPAVDLLAERFFEPIRATEPWVSDAGYYALLEVMYGTNFASSHAIIRDTVKSFVQRSQVKTARDRWATLSASEIERRRAAVREAMKARGAKRARSLEYARLIRPDVLKRLGLPEDSTSPSASTIKSDVRAILKEATGESDNA